MRDKALWTSSARRSPPNHVHKSKSGMRYSKSIADEPLRQEVRGAATEPRTAPKAETVAKEPLPLPVNVNLQQTSADLSVHQNVGSLGVQAWPSGQGYAATAPIFHRLSTEPSTAHAQLYSQSVQKQNKEKFVLQQRATLNKIKSAAKYSMLKKTIQPYRFSFQSKSRSLKEAEAEEQQVDRGESERTVDKVLRCQAQVQDQKADEKRRLRKQLIEDGEKAMELYNAHH